MWEWETKVSGWSQPVRVSHKNIIQTMAISVVMPALEMAQETGKVISWLKKEGEPVSKGEALLEVETDKAVMEIESPGDGVLAGIRVPEGAEVPVGRTIAWIVRPGEVPPADDARTDSGRKLPTASSSPKEATAPSLIHAAPGEIRVSPKARRLAAERGVDLSTICGSGPGGEILASDIPAAVSANATPTHVETPGSIARLMADRTTRAWTTVPHFFVVRELAADELVKQREKSAAVLEKQGARITHTDILVTLVARVLEKHPRLNATWTTHGIQLNRAVNISVAIAVPEGVVAPVIHNANQLNLAEVAARRSDLANRANSGKLRQSDLADGTFTISNLGMYGVDAFTAIITPPQTAILAVGAIADRVAAVNGSPVVRPMFTLVLSSDHRVVDGARAAEFMKDLAEAIERSGPR